MPVAMIDDPYFDRHRRNIHTGGSKLARLLTMVAAHGPAASHPRLVNKVPSASKSPVMPAAVTAAPAPGPTMVSGFTL